MQWVIDRLDEPSTYAGLSGLATAVGISQPLYGAISAILTAVFGLVAILKKEGKI